MDKLRHKEKKILIVEDDVQLARSLSKLLRDNLYYTRYTGNGENVLALVKKKPVDLILLDINLNNDKKKGFVICGKLKRDLITQNIPIIFITGLTDQEALVKGFDFGGDDFIIKPYKESELLSRIEYQLKQKEENTINTVRIFLASSGKLQTERNRIELFFLRKNRYFTNSRVLYMVERYENYSTSFYGKRIQNKFNNVVVECDILIVVINNDVGKFTKEEFDKAYSAFTSGDKPSNIYVYFKAIPDISGISHDTIRRVEEFKEEIKEFEQIYDSYNSIDQLLNKIEKNNKEDIEKL